MGKIVKILLSVIAVVLVLWIVLQITGIKVQVTTGISSDSLFKVQGEVCKLSEGKLYLANLVKSYKDTYGEELLEQDFNGIGAETFLKENTVAKLSKIKILNKMADQWKVSLSEEEKKLAKEAAEIYWGELGEEKGKVLGVTEKQIETMYQEYLLAEKTFEVLTQGEEIEISEDEARIIVVWHIYLKTYETTEEGEIQSYSEEEKRKVLAKADQAFKELEAGGDFASIAKNYSDDTVYEYEIGRGQMTEEFDEAAFNLEEGEISQVVETPYGYHIIKCISDFEEDKTQLNKERLLEERQFEKYEQLYEEFTHNPTAVFNEKQWQEVTLEDMAAIDTGGFFAVLDELKKVETS